MIIIGTGFIAELAIALLTLIIWVSVLTKPLILFSGHPLAQSLGVLTLLQSILSLQPTHTSEQKRIGQRIHASLNLLGFLFLVAGTVIIEYNKIKNNGPHFHSVHAYIGVVTLIVLGVQYLVGFTMWATPALYGGRENALAVWKYHRVSGYVVLVLLLATVCASTKTDYVKNVLKLPLWAPVVTSVLIVSGVFPRIQKHKFTFRGGA